MRKESTWSDPRVAADYERRRFRSALGRRKHRRDETLVLSLLERACAGPRVLDVPCGTGRLAPALARSGRTVTGVDLSPPMLREASRAARGAGRPALLCASALRLPFADGSFDAAVSVRFLFHLDDRSERVRFLAELARVCMGPLILQARYRRTAKHAGRWLRSGLGLARRYRPSQGRAELARELAEAGLELRELAPVSSLFSDKAFLLAVPGPVSTR